MSKKTEFDLGNKVVQSNELIVGKWGLNASLLKLFEMAVSCIDTSKDLPSREVHMSKQDIYELFDYTSTRKYTHFREVTRELQKQVVTFNMEDGRRRDIVLIPTVEWGTKESDDLVIFKFHEDIMPFLIELQEHFTQYQIAELKFMKSQYSIVLFKYFVMEYNKRIKHSKDGIVDIYLDMRELRYITNTENIYAENSRITDKVIEVAVNEINGIGLEIPTTSYLVKYDIKRGKYNKIEGYYFSIRKRFGVEDRVFDNYTFHQSHIEKTTSITKDEFHKKYKKSSFI